MTKCSQSSAGVVLQFPYPKTLSGSEGPIEEAFVVLSQQKRELYHEFLRVAERLDRKGVPGVYGEVASVAERVTRLKCEGRTAMSALAQGLDTLKRSQAAYRKGAAATSKLLVAISILVLSAWWALASGQLNAIP